MDREGRENLKNALQATQLTGGTLTRGNDSHVAQGMMLRSRSPPYAPPRRLYCRANDAHILILCERSRGGSRTGMTVWCLLRSPRADVVPLTRVARNPPLFVKVPDHTKFNLSSATLGKRQMGGENIACDFGGRKRTKECTLQTRFWRPSKVGLFWSVPTRNADLLRELLVAHPCGDPNRATQCRA